MDFIAYEPNYNNNRNGNHVQTLECKVERFLSSNLHHDIIDMVWITMIIYNITDHGMERDKMFY